MEFVTKIKYVRFLGAASAVMIVIFALLYVSVRNEALREVAAVEANLNVLPTNGLPAEDLEDQAEATAIFGADLATLDPALIALTYTDESQGVIQDTTVFFSVDAPENQYQNYLRAIVLDGWVITNEYSSPTLYSVYAIKDDNQEMNITIVPTEEGKAPYRSQISVSQTSR